MLFFLILFVCHVIGATELVVKDVSKKDKTTFQPIVKKAKSLVQNNRTKIPLIVSVAGCSGVGKTHFAQELADCFKENGIQVALLHFDDFLDPDYNDSIGFHPRFRYQDAHACMEEIVKGKKVIIKPAWNKHKKSKKCPSKIQETFSIEDAQLILVEGEFTLCPDKPYDFEKYAAFGIFVDAQDEDIIDWDWTRGRSIPEKTKKKFTANRKPSLKKYRQYVQPARNTANYLLIKNPDHSSALFQRV